MADATDSGSVSRNGVLVQVQSSVKNFTDILSRYQLLCFDFDGLLVDTERLHFEAYKEMLNYRGCHLDWDFETYCRYSHADRFSLKNAVISLFPHIANVDWEICRQEKQIHYEKRLMNGEITLMPGVEKMLEILSQSPLERCVVTNSPNDHLEILKKHIPLLATIPLWIGRNEYKNPKPHPDPYLTAAHHFPEIPKHKILAFEDSMKGGLAAIAAGIHLVLICPTENPHRGEAPLAGIPHFQSFLELL